jgi:capsular exopolysaccharide synthesis family protein
LSQGDTLTTQAAVIRSFPVLERAAKTLQIIPATLDSEAVKQNPAYVQALSDLRNRVAASPEENTTLINITVTSREPVEATRIANAVAQAYQQENGAIRNKKILEARRFIEEQLRDVDGRLRNAEDGIRALKEQRRFVSLADETTASVARLTALETEYDRVRREQADVAEQIQVALGALDGAAAAPRWLGDGADPATVKLSSALVDLQLERESLLLTLTPQHPQIRDLDARIANLQGNLDARLRVRREEQLRESRGKREDVLRELRFKSQALDGRAAELQRQIQSVRQEQRNLPDLSHRFAQLQRELALNETLQSTLRSKLQEVQIKEREQVDEVGLVRPATVPGAPTNPPQTAAKAIVGLLIGLTVGLVLAFVLESMDTSIGTIQDVESYLDLPVLGLIPLIDPVKDPLLAPPDDEDEASPLGRMRPFLVSLLNPRSTVAEAYRSLRTNVEFLSLEKNAKVMCMTSASLMEGKTTTAVNLAISVAQMGKKTLLVEADLRKPFLHHAFGIPRDPGLTEVIVGNKDWRECLRTATDLMLGPLGVDTLMNTPNIDKLYLLTSGTPPPNPAEFLNSQRMNELIAAFREEFDVVIFDCPPILPVTDAAILASKTDGTMIVYRVGKIARSALRRAKILLENVRGRVLGVVLTGLKAEISSDYEELEYYRYAYGQEPGRSDRMRTVSSRRTLLEKVRGLFS